MKKELLIGTVLAAAVLVAVTFAPSVLSGNATAQAARDAELARRELHAYDARLTLTGLRAQMDRLKDADYEALAARVGETLQSRLQDVAPRIQGAKTLDRTNALPNSALPLLSTDANGMRGGVKAFEARLTHNAELLTSAGKNAQKALTAARGAPTVGEVSGMVKLTEAGDWLGQARLMRTELSRLQVLALSLASDWLATRALMDHYKGLDSSEVESALRGDVADLEAQIAAARTELERVSTELSAREAELATVRQQLLAKRAEMSSVEDRGFQAGNDADFHAFRDALRRLSEELKTLQTREQLLAVGGLEGGTWVDDGTEAGAIDGGSPALGVEPLRRRVDALTLHVERLTRSRDGLQTALRSAGGYQQDARTGEKRFDQQLQKLQAEFAKVNQRIDELATEVANVEAKAKAAATTAANDFEKAAAAARDWKEAQLKTQRTYDAEGRNDRFKLIKNDARTERVATMGRAEALALVGRIQAERLAGEVERKSTLERLTRMIPGSQYNREEIDKQISEARDAAASALNEAKSTYARLADDDKTASWLHNLSLASVALLLARVDPQNAAGHQADAAEAVRNAAKLKDSPFFRREYAALVELVLGKGSEPAPAAPAAGDPGG